MSAPAQAFVLEARLAILAGTDPAAVGAAVTAALCGAPEHEGPCRWPHNNAIRAAGDTFEFRTLFVAVESEENVVCAKIEDALRSRREWTFLGCGRRAISDDEVSLAERLAAGTRRGPA